MTTIIAPFDPFTASEADLADVYAMGVAVGAVEWPEDPAPTYEAAVGRLRQAMYHEQAADALWAAHVDDRLVGWAKLSLMAGVNSALAIIEVRVHPDHRRHGIGTALLRSAAVHAAEHGRGTLLPIPVKPDSAGEHWVGRLGFTITRHTVIQRLVVRGDTSGKEWDAPVAPGYRLVQWSAAAPEELIASYAKARQAIADAPSGNSTFSDDLKWTPESIREQERKEAEDGTDSRVIVAISEADGSVAGVTNVVRYAHNPQLGLQMETSVLRAHRGHGLGLALKGAMVRTLLAAWPELERIHTSNARDNEHMLAVNRALGYRPIRELTHVEIETARLMHELPPAPLNPEESESPMDEIYTLPPGLPVPQDDGAADHLPSAAVPDLALPSTAGETVALGALGGGRTVVYIYPLSGRPGEDLPEGWNAIPGARGCTTEACDFRDHHEELLEAGAARVFGLSSQDTGYQQELAGRLRLPFAMLSDTGLRLAEELGLPTFEAVGQLLYKRITLVVRDGVVEHAFYPIFPPDRHAGEVLAWLTDNPVQRTP